MLSTTLGDELKMATGGRESVRGEHERPRAKLPAGHGADGAFGLRRTRTLCVSTYYGESLPDWLIGLHHRLGGSADGQGWDRLRDESVYAQCLPDNNPYEGAFRAAQTLSYVSKPCENDLLKGTPGGNTLVVDFALAAIEGAELGQDDVTDLLALISAPQTMRDTGSVRTPKKPWTCTCAWTWS